MQHDPRLLCQRGHDHGGVPLPSGVDGGDLLRQNPSSSLQFPPESPPERVRSGMEWRRSVELLPPRDVGLVQDLQSTAIQWQAVKLIYLTEHDIWSTECVGKFYKHKSPNRYMCPAIGHIICLSLKVTRKQMRSVQSSFNILYL